MFRFAKGKRTVFPLSLQNETKKEIAFFTFYLNDNELLRHVDLF